MRNMEERFTYTDTYARPMFDRGFTGHEHLQAFGLINMNGRMYDPVMSSFLSADRYMQDPTTAQGFNRYAYCMYNPLRYVDPTGWVFIPSHGSPPRSYSGLIQDYLSDPCYITRQQLRDAGIYCVEGGYGYVGGNGTMGAHWMEGFGIGHYTSWDIQTDKGGFEAGAWAIPDSFYPMWINYCQGLCNYGNYGCLNENNNNNSMVSTGNEGGRNNSFVNKSIFKYYNSFLGYVASTESILLGARSYGLKQLKNKTILDDLGKSLRSSYESRGIVQKGASGIAVGKAAVKRMSTTSDILGGVGIACVGMDIVLNGGIVYPSHVLDASVGIVSLSMGPPGWIVGGVYFVVDLGCYAFSGNSFGQQLNTWCGGVSYDIKTNSIIY